MSDTVREGRIARRMLEDDVFERAVDRADETFVEQWRSADTMEEREQAHAKQAALAEVIRQLRIIADDGKLAEQAVED